MVKIQFLTKSSQKMANGLVSEKNFFIFVHNRVGGMGGVRTLYGIFHIFFYFFLEPFPNWLINIILFDWLYYLCSEAVSLTTMRGHTKSAHKMSIADYKEKYGNHRTQIIDEIYHECGLCAEVDQKSDLNSNLDLYF